jgi:hypothetical protein
MQQTRAFAASKDTITKFLKPNRINIVVFLIFIFIAFAGQTQSWMFVDDAGVVPKPYLYDLLQPFPLWLLWVFLLSPLILISNVIVSIGGYEADFITRGPGWSFLVIQVVYFYTISCLAALILGIGWHRLTS